MKKTLILAMVGVLLISGSAFAGRELTARPNATFVAGVGGAAFGPSTTNNDDSCDIGTAPAASLLLPYFHVDLTATAGTGRTTLFSITNVSPYAQIAHIVLYTDWSFPVIDFNIFLTGYDVQAINLYDVIQRGLIGGTTTGTSTSSPNAFSTTTGLTNNRFAPNAAGTTGTNPNIGTQPFLVSSANSFGNPNFLGTVANNCAPGRLPGQLPGPLATDVRALLSVGRSTGSGISCISGGVEAQVGSNHGANVAIGYATVDVAATCSVALPIDLSYFTGEILFDNVLIGEYFDVNQSTAAGNYAGGNPMVHIRAIPEGGPVAAAGIPAGVTNLPFTFYDRYTVGAADRRIDRRQPLPSTYAARWIAGSSGLFDTRYKVWREGFTGNTTSSGCGDYDLNDDMGVAEFVRFDERENAGVLGLGGIIVSPAPPGQPGLPEAAEVPITSSLFPTVAGSADVAGWMYMNLNNGGAASAPAGAVTYSASRPGFGAAAGTRDVSQNWVTISMFAESRYGTEFDAAWLGNGCSMAFPLSSSGVAQSPQNRIAPAGGVLVCPPGMSPTGGVAFGVGSATPTPTSGGTLNCQGTNVTP